MVLKTSHDSGDVTNRAKVRKGKGAKKNKGPLYLIEHPQEVAQLKKCLAYYQENQCNPSASDVFLNLKSIGMDLDYRKGNGALLVKKNATNLMKRMLVFQNGKRNPAQRDSVKSVKTTKTKIQRPTARILASEFSEVGKSYVLTSSVVSEIVQHVPVLEDEEFEAARKLRDIKSSDMEVEFASEILLSLSKDETETVISPLQPTDPIWSISYKSYATAAEESFLTAVRNRKRKYVDDET